MWEALTRFFSKPGGSIVFIINVPQAVLLTPNVRLDSQLASNRLRVFIPAMQLSARTKVWLAPYSELLRDANLTFSAGASAAVLTKLPASFVQKNRDSLDKMLDAMSRRTRNYRLYADLSDDYAALGSLMNMPYLKRYQQRLGEVAELVACGPALRDALSPYAKRGLHVVEDPFESMTAREPREPRSDPVRLLWFGNLAAANLPFVSGALAEIAGKLTDLALEIELVFAAEASAAMPQIESALKARHPRIRASFTPWSIEATEAAIERSHIVLLPQDWRSEYGRVKSANRLVSAIRGGRFVVASPIPAYEELSQYAWVGEDLAEGVRWALAHPAEARQRIVAGQTYVSTRFSPQAIGERWAQVLGL